MIIDDLVRGSIDMHCHHAPDAMIEGRMDALETITKSGDLITRRWNLWRNSARKWSGCLPIPQRIPEPI